MNRFIYQAVFTPNEEGGYDVEFPDLPGCFSFGDTFQEAAAMAADAAKTYLASLMKHDECIPAAEQHQCPKGSECVLIFFETDPTYVIEGDVVSAAQAARELGISASRVTQMLNSNLLEGFRNGRRTYVTKRSIEERKKAAPSVGRPKKAAVTA